MRKITFLFAYLLLTVPYAKGADVNLVELVKEIRPAVVTVITYDEDKKPSGLGSGFFIDKEGHLITNYHVLKGAYSAEVKTFDGTKYPVKLVLAESELADLIKVLVDIPEKAVKFVQVARAIPEVAEREQVIVVDSPMGLEQTVSEGIVSAVRDIPTIGKIFQISAPVSKGSSGSPVANMKGQVIGVATLKLIGGQNLNFAVSGEQVLALKSEKKSRTLTEWTLGISVKEMDVGGNVYKQGLKFLWAAEYKKALDHFKKVIMVNRNFAEAWFYAGYCYDELSRYQEAMEACKKAISIKPDYAEAHSNLGMAYDELGRHQEAMEAYKQAIRIKPDYAEAHSNLGTAYERLGSYQEAMEAFKQAISIKPYYVKAHSNLGIAYGGLGRYQDAKEAFKQAIRIKPDYVHAHYGLGLACLMLRDKDSALDEFKILKTLDEDLAYKLLNLTFK